MNIIHSVVTNKVLT